MAFTINSKANSYYNLFHTSTKIDAPAPKRVSVEIPLADGSLDLTDLLTPGVVRYATRTITIGCELHGLRSTWPGQYSTILSDIHGQKVEVVFDNDPLYAWEGYATVSALDDHGASAGVTITVQADPFKKTAWALDSTYSAPIGVSVGISVGSGTQRVYMQFDTTAALTVSYDGQTWSVPAGVSTCYGLVLTTPGTNYVDITSTGDVEVYLRTGVL